MSGQIHIRCNQCGTFNLNSEYCQNCGTLLSVTRQREQKRAQEQEEKAQKALVEKPSRVEAFIQKMRNHRWFVVRALFEIVYVGWVVAMAIAAFIAWLIAAIVA